MKKFFGVFFIILFALAFFGAISNGSLLDASSAPAVKFGQILGYALLLASSIFFFLLDKSSSMPMVKGFRLRQKLAPVSIFFFVIFCILLAITYIGTSSNLSTDFYLNSTLTDFMLLALLRSLPWLISFLIFTYACTYWFMPVLSYNSVLKSTNTNLDVYAAAQFVPIDNTGKVLASQHALFLKEQMLLIPFDRIKSTALKEVKIGSLVLESNVNIFFINDKKITITTKEYDAIQRVVRK